MSTLVVSPKPTTPDRESEVQQQLVTLGRRIALGQGQFSVGLIEYDLPRQRHRILETLQVQYPNILTVDLTPTRPGSNVLDQLLERIRFATEQVTPQALFVFGLETLFPSDIPDSCEEVPPALVPVLQPFNLGRNILAKHCPYPVLFCLPPDAMALFIRFTPDLITWTNGFYTFLSEREVIQPELTVTQEVQDRKRWKRTTRAKLLTDAEPLVGMTTK